MTFNSLAFLAFFPVVLLFHFLTPRKYRVVPLLILSYYFYACWNVKLMGLILFTTVVSYISGLLMEKTEKKGIRRLLLTVTLIACLGVLFFYKYFNFFVSTVGMLSPFFHCSVPVTVSPSFPLNTTSVNSNVDNFCPYVSF